MKEQLYTGLKELAYFTEGQIQKVLDFEKANPEVMDGLRSMMLPVERGGWEVEKFFLNGNELLVTVSFTGYEYNNQICLPAFDAEWANERIQSYITEHEKLLARKQQRCEQQRTEELQLLAELKQKYEPEK